MAVKKRPIVTENDKVAVATLTVGLLRHSGDWTSEDYMRVYDDFIERLSSKNEPL